VFEGPRNELQPHWHLDQTQGEHLPETNVFMLVRYSKEAGGKDWAKTHCFVSDASIPIRL
jgi:hypothetical protein